MSERAVKDPSGDFRLDIQGMRAIAVAMVVIYHLRPSLLPGGFVGVDVFFVISGYLITGHLWRGYRKTGTVSLLDFWGRRVRRLMPAAALVLLVSWLAARLVAPATELASIGTQIRASALYFQNWQLASDSVNYLNSDTPATPVQHFWSLSVEEQFYLVWPLLFVIAMIVTMFVAGGRKARHSRRAAASRRAGLTTVAAAATVLVVCSLAYSVYDTKSDPAAAYFVTTTRMWELGVGGLLAMAPARLRGVVGRQGWLSWAGLAAVITSAFTLSGASPFPGWVALVPVAGAVALLAGGSTQGRFGPAALTSARPMVFLGGISYSLYLWHWPIINLYGDWRGQDRAWLTDLTIVIVSVLLAWLTKIFVEDEFRLSPLLAGHRWRSVAVALAAAVPVASVSVYLAHPVTWNGRIPASGYPGAAALASQTRARVPVNPILPPITDALADLPLYWQDNCLDGDGTTTEKACVFGDTRKPALTVAMVATRSPGTGSPRLSRSPCSGTGSWSRTCTARASGRPPCGSTTPRTARTPYASSGAWRRCTT